MHEDSQLAINIQETNCEKSLRTLIEKHSRLCFDILQKFTPILKDMGYHTADMFDAKDFLIYKSAIKFKPDRGAKFSTWLGNYTRYHCLTLLSQKNKQRVFCQEDEIIKFKLDKLSETKHEEGKQNENFQEFIAFLLDGIKDKRAKDIYMLRYFSTAGEKMTWKKIAKKVGVSSQTAINIHNRARKILKNKIKSKNNFDFV